MFAARSTRLRRPLAAAAVVVIAAAAFAAAEPAVPVSRLSLCDSTGGYPWPVKPFRTAHPVRSNIGEPRLGDDETSAASFHNGVDIAAAEGASVYPVLSGTVVRVNGAGVVVRANDGRRFQYWHIVPRVTAGEYVVAGVTVIGQVHELKHVHLAELDVRTRGVVRNPLAPGHLAPYADATQPQVESITLAGREVAVSATDRPALAVPPPWNDLPVAPAYLAYTVRQADGPVIAGGTVFDFRSTLPVRRLFWSTYAPGAQKNRPGVPGRYLFRFTLPVLPAGRYVLSLVAEDTCGNRGRRSTALTVP